MEKKYYKAVQIKDGKLLSISCPKDVILEYSTEFDTIPQHGQLCCFSSLQTARRFAASYGNCVCYRCEIGQVYEYPEIPWLSCRGSINILKAFQTVERLKKAGKAYLHLCYLPEAFPAYTVFTDKIRLVEKVSSWTILT